MRELKSGGYGDRDGGMYRYIYINGFVMYGSRARCLERRVL
jgi:hypothetical protein